MVQALVFSTLNSELGNHILQLRHHAGSRFCHMATRHRCGLLLRRHSSLAGGIHGPADAATPFMRTTISSMLAKMASKLLRFGPEQLPSGHLCLRRQW